MTRATQRRARDRSHTRALILTYHAVEAGPSPLCISPDLFRTHLDCIVDAQAETFTIRELVARMRERRLPERAVAITFDDAFASAVHVAAPLLEERDLTATFFCIGGFVGGMNDWPTQPERAPRSALAGADDLQALVSRGFEIGAHGMTHAPLVSPPEVDVEQELVGAKEILSGLIGAEVTSLAYPYGIEPDDQGRSVVAATYSAACTAKLGYVGPGDDPLSLRRVDAHFVRRPRALSMALLGSGAGYLTARRWATRARHSFVRDYTSPASVASPGGRA